MSHHASGPNFGFPRGDARLDLTDFYAFLKPADPGESILVFNVHPSAGLNPPGPTTKEPFAPGALYEIKIDTNAMPSPIFVTARDSGLATTGSRPRRYSVFRARQPRGPATKAKLSSREHRSQTGRMPW